MKVEDPASVAWCDSPPVLVRLDYWELNSSSIWPSSSAHSHTFLSNLRLATAVCQATGHLVVDPTESCRRNRNHRATKNEEER